MNLRIAHQQSSRKRDAAMSVFGWIVAASVTVLPIVWAIAGGAR